MARNTVAIRVIMQRPSDGPGGGQDHLCVRALLAAAACQSRPGGVGPGIQVAGAVTVRGAASVNTLDYHDCEYTGGHGARPGRPAEPDHDRLSQARARASGRLGKDPDSAQLPSRPIGLSLRPAAGTASAAWPGRIRPGRHRNTSRSAAGTAPAGPGTRRNRRGHPTATRRLP